MRTVFFIAFLCTVAASPGYAQDDGWHFVATSKDGDDTYSVKLGSGERSQNKQGETMTVFVGKDADKKSGRVELFKVYVTDSDCSQEYGNLVVLTVDGTFVFDAPFAKGSNNIASAIAETICDVTAKAEGKSIKLEG